MASVSNSIVPDLGEVIAERSYQLKRKAKRGMRVIVRVGTPVPDPNPPGRDWACPYEIIVSGKSKTRVTFGVDSMQALELTLRILPTHLAVLARAQKGKIYRFGQPDTTIPNLPTQRSARRRS